MKITFDLKKFKEWLDGIEETHVGRCGEYFYKEYSLDDEGDVIKRHYSYSFKMKPEAEKWKKTRLRGELSE